MTITDENLKTSSTSPLNVSSALALLLSSLRSNSGQTPADLAQAHGFDDCFHVIMSKSQLCGSENGVNGVQNGNGALCGQHQHSRKRMLTAMDTESMKKARRVESKMFMKCIYSFILLNLLSKTLVFW